VGVVFVLSKNHWIMIRVCNLGNVQRGMRPSLFRTNQLIDLVKLYAVCINFQGVCCRHLTVWFNSVLQFLQERKQVTEQFFHKIFAYLA
jgi:hypothetical protein